MKKKPLLLFAFAATSGLMAMLGVNQLIPQNQAAEEQPTAKVLMAKGEIGPGTPLTEENVKFVEYPEDLIPPGAVTDKSEYVGRAITVRTIPGTIIMKGTLGDPGVVGVSSDIPDQMRLISVPVDDTMSNSGMILPGSRVDVIVTYKHPDPKIGIVSATVLEHIEVFSNGSQRDLLDAVTKTKENKSAKNIGLLVSPKEAPELKRAEQLGKLHLMMRRLGDATKSGTKNWMDQLKGEQPKPPTKDDRSSLEKFLDGDDDTKAEEEIAESTDKTKWRIQIFAGGSMRVEEVDLPESEWANKEEDNVPVSAEKGTEDETSKETAAKQDETTAN